MSDKIEVTITLNRPSAKPVTYEIICFVTKNGEHCFGSYIGDGVWRDLSSETYRQDKKTKDIAWWWLPPNTPD